jgi:uncharacterized protein YegP (UPF0339 family)
MNDRPDRVQVKVSEDDQFYVVLSAPNGEVLLTSETYTREETAYETANRLVAYSGGRIVLDTD